MVTVNILRYNCNQNRGPIREKEIQQLVLKFYFFGRPLTANAHSKMLRYWEHPKKTSSLSEGTTLETSQHPCFSYLLTCGGH